jgi:hypothetical protein
MSPVTDTSPEVAAMVRDRIMKLSGAERFVISARMFESARIIVLASLPRNISETERKRMLYERFYGERLPRAVGQGISESEALASGMQKRRMNGAEPG